MNLTTTFLKERHQYWAKILKDSGIFAIVLGLPNFLEIKYGVKSLNGIYRVRSGISRIILYPYNVDVDQQWADNVLVHEMIHQYIHVQKIKDTSSHGQIFKHYMNLINGARIGVTISVRTNSNKFILPTQTTAELSKILVLKFTDRFFLCKIKSTSIHRFTENILTNKIKFKWELVGFGWYKSHSAYFKAYQNCVTNLHGEVFPNNKWNEIFEKYGLTKYEVISEL